jgi:predicted O-methyltransferase YrrM
MKHFFKEIHGWFDYQDFYKSMAENFGNAKFIEIGSWKGRSAAFMAVEIANSNKNIEFTCIDTWLGSPEHQDLEIIKKDILFEEFCKNIEPVENFIKIKRKESTEAAKDYDDKSLNFVFIDANHEYEFIKQDIKAWFKKIKKGGVLAGHDYSEQHWPGVKKAVDEFSKNNNLNLVVYKDQQVWAFFV